MAWEPITEEKIRHMLEAAWDRMNGHQRRLWAAICIIPEKWQQHPYGDEGDGFWAVALLGRTVVWYNDIEGGFNRSRYTHYGTIDDYWCDQSELESAIEGILYTLESGRYAGPAAGPPEPFPR
jgi:hypothetical protein